MSHIYIVFLKCLEFRQMCFERPGLVSLYMCTKYPLSHTLLAQKQSKHIKHKFRFQAPFWCTNTRGSMQAVRELQCKAPVQGYCIGVQWPLNVTWALGLSTGQSFHGAFLVKWDTFQCTMTPPTYLTPPCRNQVIKQWGGLQSKELHAFMLDTYPYS